jgi:hypothetical protein
MPDANSALCGASSDPILFLRRLKQSHDLISAGVMDRVRANMTTMTTT